MPKGFSSAREAIAEIEARKNSGGGGGFFKLPNSGDSAVVRFVTEEPVWAWVHALPKEGTSYRTEVCLDQDMETGNRNGAACPGCDAEAQTGRERGWKDRQYARRMAGAIALIWRDAPVFDEDSNGRKDYTKVVGKADQATKWTFGKTVIEELDGKAATFKGLTNRDFRITRKGEKLDTVYDIEPVVDDEGNTKATPMSEADKTLVEEAPDLTNYFTQSSYDDFGKSRQSGGDSGGSAAPPTTDVSPFARSRG
jgi:hypothetical protein